MNILNFSKSDSVLLYNLTKIQVKDKYMASKLGILWAIINPLLFLGTYAFVFTFIFKARKLTDNTADMTKVIWLLSGLVPYLSISESIMATANSVISSKGLVKNLIFKVELLPFVATLTAFVPFVIGLGFLFILMIINGSIISWHVVLLPFIIILQYSFLASLGLFFGMFTVFIQDILQTLQTLCLCISFFTPIFYDIKAVPPLIQKITFFNPFHQIVEPYRAILIKHQLPNLKGLIYLFILTNIMLFLGLKLFRKFKGYFSSAI